MVSKWATQNAWNTRGEGTHTLACARIQANAHTDTHITQAHTQTATRSTRNTPGRLLLCWTLWASRRQRCSYLYQNWLCLHQLPLGYNSKSESAKNSNQQTTKGLKWRKGKQQWNIKLINAPPRWALKLNTSRATHIKRAKVQAMSSCVWTSPPAIFVRQTLPESI